MRPILSAPLAPYHQQQRPFNSPIIIVFLTPGAETQFQREPLQQERKIQAGWENFAIFD